LTWLLPQIPTVRTHLCLLTFIPELTYFHQEYLLPHSSLLLLFTTSAQTHIFAEIRIDAIRFLDLYLDVLPSVVVAGWEEDGDTHGSRVLDGYLSILNAGTKFGGNEGRFLRQIVIVLCSRRYRSTKSNIYSKCCAVHSSKWPRLPVHTSR
jgi:hypothetical protein